MQELMVINLYNIKKPDISPRCDGFFRGRRCNKLLNIVKVYGYWEAICPRCGKLNRKMLDKKILKNDIRQ